MILAVGGAVRCSSGSGNVVQPPGDEGGANSGASSSGSGGSGSTTSSGTSSGGTSSGETSGTGSSGETSGTGGSGTGGSGGTGGGGVTDAGLVVDATADGGCLSQTSQTLATKVSFQVGWPASTAGTKGTGTINIWLLTHLTGDTTVSGSAQSCGLTLPDLTLSSLGMTATGGGTKIQIQILNSTWDKVSRTFNVTGTEDGWNIGDTQDTNPAVALIGLTSSSTYASDTQAWPAVCATGKCASSPPVTCMGGTCSGTYAGSFPGSMVTDDDGDGFPGVTANPRTSNGYVLPPTADLFAASADQVYIVSRNEIAISGKRMTDCTHQTGTASVTLFDNHVVGCHTAAYTSKATGMHPAAACTSDEVGFLDTNRTIYGYDDTAGDSISKAHPVVGTSETVELAAGAKCSDVRAAVP